MVIQMIVARLVFELSLNRANEDSIRLLRWLTSESTAWGLFTGAYNRLKAPSPPLHSKNGARATCFDQGNRYEIALLTEIQSALLLRSKRRQSWDRLEAPSPPTASVRYKVKQRRSCFWQRASAKKRRAPNWVPFWVRSG